MTCSECSSPKKSLGKLYEVGTDGRGGDGGDGREARGSLSNPLGDSWLVVVVGVALIAVVSIFKPEGLKKMREGQAILGVEQLEWEWCWKMGRRWDSTC